MKNSVGATLLSPTAKISLASLIPPVYTDTVSARLFENVGAQHAVPMKNSVGATLLSPTTPSVRATSVASFVPQTSRSANQTLDRSPGLFSRFLSAWDRSVETALTVVGPKPARAAWSQYALSFDRLSFYHTDHLGSIRVVTDRSGNLYERIDYSPFGEIFNDDIYPPAGSDYTTDDYDGHREKFTGQQWDYRTGLYYYGARYYDPEVGRFTSADTVVPRASDGQSINRYSYCFNNPYKYVDPSGHNPLSEFFIALGEAIIVTACTLTGAFIGLCLGNPLLGATLGFIIGSGIVGGIESARHGGEFSSGFGMGIGSACIGIATGGFSSLVMLTYGIVTLCASNDGDAWAYFAGSLIGGFASPNPSEAVSIVENGISSKMSSIFSNTGPGLPGMGPGGEGSSYIGWLSDKAKGVVSSGKMTYEFITGTGPDYREYGPDTLESRNLRNFYLVNMARRQWYDLNRTNYEVGAPLLPLPRKGYEFGVMGPQMAGLDPTEQFVGSIYITIEPSQDGKMLNITVENKTSLHSASYHLLPEHSRSENAIMGNTWQTYRWSEPINPELFK